MSGANKFIVAHNHPNGSKDVSVNDINITRKIQEMANFIEVDFLQHFTIGNDGYDTCIDNGEDDNDFEENNEEDENYWILISARRLDMPVTRRGCIVLYRSKNLKDWTYYGPIYSPGHTNCPECPEMYKMGGHWYLSYSRFSEFVNTIYRVSESPFGPWRKPKKDGIGGRRFYAAKSMQNDDGRRFYF